MAVIRWDKFLGTFGYETPEHLLPDEAASFALDCKLDYGGIAPISEAKKLTDSPFDLTYSTATIWSPEVIAGTTFANHSFSTRTHTYSFDRALHDAQRIEITWHNKCWAGWSYQTGIMERVTDDPQPRFEFVPGTVPWLASTEQLGIYEYINSQWTKVSDPYAILWPDEGVVYFYWGYPHETCMGTPTAFNVVMSTPTLPPGTRKVAWYEPLGVLLESTQIETDFCDAQVEDDAHGRYVVSGFDFESVDPQFATTRPWLITKDHCTGDRPYPNGGVGLGIPAPNQFDVITCILQDTEIQYGESEAANQSKYTRRDDTPDQFTIPNFWDRNLSGGGYQYQALWLGITGLVSSFSTAVAKTDDAGLSVSLNTIDTYGMTPTVGWGSKQVVYNGDYLVLRLDANPGFDVTKVYNCAVTIGGMQCHFTVSNMAQLDYTLFDAGESIKEYRTYAATYVDTTYGGESAPHVLGSFECRNDTKKNLIISRTAVDGVTAPDSFHLSSRAKKLRIYRTASGTASSEFFFVKEIEVPSFDTSVTVEDDVQPASLVDILTSTDFDMPPEDLKYVTPLLGGFMAGYSATSKTICFSQPGYPDAWPVPYRLGVRDNVVGLIQLAGSLLVLTDNVPYLADGTHPSAMALTQVAIALPCVSRHSAVDFGHRVIYASTNGLVSIAAGGAAEEVTNAVISEDFWSFLISRELIATNYEGKYLALWAGISEADMSNTGRYPWSLWPTNQGNAHRIGFLLDPLQVANAGFEYLYHAFNGDLDPNFGIPRSFAYYPPAEATLFTTGNGLYLMDGKDSAEEYYHWCSKWIELPVFESMAVIRIDWDNLNGFSRTNVPFKYPVRLYYRVFALGSGDGTTESPEVCVTEDRNDAVSLDDVRTGLGAGWINVVDQTDRPLQKRPYIDRLPTTKHGGSDRWRIEITGTAYVRRAYLSTTMRELSRG